MWEGSTVIRTEREPDLPIYLEICYSYREFSHAWICKLHQSEHIAIGNDILKNLWKVRVTDLLRIKIIFSIFELCKFIRNQKTKIILRMIRKSLKHEKFQNSELYKNSLRVSFACYFPLIKSMLRISKNDSLPLKEPMMVQFNRKQIFS